MSEISFESTSPEERAVSLRSESSDLNAPNGLSVGNLLEPYYDESSATWIENNTHQKTIRSTSTAQKNSTISSESEATDRTSSFNVEVSAPQGKHLTVEVEQITPNKILATQSSDLRTQRPKAIKIEPIEE